MRRFQRNPFPALSQAAPSVQKAANPKKKSPGAQKKCCSVTKLSQNFSSTPPTKVKTFPHHLQVGARRASTQLIQPNPHTMKKTLFAILGLAAVSLAGVNGQLLSWDMSGIAGNSTSVTALTIASNLETTAGLNTLTRTGLTAATLANSFNSSNWTLTNTFDESNKYISFSLTPSPGYQFTSSNISYAINGTNTAPNTGRWGYKIGSGSFILQDTFSLGSATPSLATWSFTEFTTTETVEFRFWSFSATSINGGASASGGAVRIFNISGNDLVLNGSVTVVPEPTTWALIGLGTVFVLWRIRRKRVVG
jgi:hypothetical protein